MYKKKFEWGKTYSNWNTTKTSMVTNNNIPSTFYHIEGKMLDILQNTLENLNN